MSVVFFSNPLTTKINTVLKERVQLPYNAIYLRAFFLAQHFIHFRPYSTLKTFCTINLQNSVMRVHAFRLKIIKHLFWALLSRFMVRAIVRIGSALCWLFSLFLVFTKSHGSHWSFTLTGKWKKHFLRAFNSFQYEVDESSSALEKVVKNVVRGESRLRRETTGKLFRHASSAWISVDPSFFIHFQPKLPHYVGLLSCFKEPKMQNEKFCSPPAASTQLRIQRRGFS